MYVGPFESGELGKSWNAQGSLLVHFSTISSSGSCAFLRHTPRSQSDIAFVTRRRRYDQMRGRRPGKTGGVFTGIH